jgi:dolichol kinase
VTFWISEALRAAAVGAAFLAVFAAAELWKRLASPPPEWTRKAVHVGGGLVSLSLPWVIRSHWTVLALGAAFALLILGTRRLGLLGSVHGVERKSEGGLYFPAAVYLLFLVTADQPVFYLISLLTLVVSDALAALVGTSYGRHTFTVETDRKSLEGSAVFLLATFLAAHLPLLLLTDLGRAESVLVAAQLALLVTIFEAVSLRGNDNLIVPLATYLLLLKMTTKGALFIGLQLVAQLGILVLLIILVWRVRFLTFSGTIAASLFFYAAWSLGGPAWTLAPAAGLMALLTVLRRTRHKRGQPSPRYRLLATFYTGLVPGSLLLANNLLETQLYHPVLGRGDPFYPWYVGAVAGHLALLTRVFMEDSPWLERSLPGRSLAAWGVGALAVVPVGVLAMPGRFSAAEAAVALLLPALALPAYESVCRWREWPREGSWDARLQALSVGTSAAVLLLAALGTGSLPRGGGGST